MIRIPFKPNLPYLKSKNCYKDESSSDEEFAEDDLMMCSICKDESSVDDFNDYFYKKDSLNVCHDCFYEKYFIIENGIHKVSLICPFTKKRMNKDQIQIVKNICLKKDLDIKEEVEFSFHDFNQITEKEKKIRLFKTPGKVNFSNKVYQENLENQILTDKVNDYPVLFKESIIKNCELSLTPCCKKFFTSFDGCLTIGCHHCGKNFCGRCFGVINKKDGDDPHKHVRELECNKVLGGEIFKKNEDFSSTSEIQEFVKKRKVYEILKIIFMLYNEKLSLEEKKNIILKDYEIKKCMRENNLDIIFFENIFFNFREYDDFEGIDFVKWFKMVIYKNYKLYLNEQYQMFYSFGNLNFKESDVYFKDILNDKNNFYYYFRWRLTIPPSEVFEKMENHQIQFIIDNIHWDFTKFYIV